MKATTKMSFKEKLIAKLVNNIQIELKNVHVRYEGQSKETKDAFCFGATLGGLLFKVGNNHQSQRVSTISKCLTYFF